MFLWQTIWGIDRKQQHKHKRTHIVKFSRIEQEWQSKNKEKLKTLDLLYKTKTSYKAVGDFMQIIVES